MLLLLPLIQLGCCTTTAAAATTTNTLSIIFSQILKYFPESNA